MRRRVFHRARYAVLVLPTVFVAACLIAEPPTDAPKFPTFRPTIVRDGCSPNANLILGSFPDKFVVPVELVDPGKSFEWRLFYDYDAISGGGLQAQAYGTSSFDPKSAQRNIRFIETAPRAPADLTTCHVIEVVVANAFVIAPTLSGQGLHPPDATGSDSVTWFYAPNGDMRSCGVFLTDASTDAGADAGDARDGGG